MKQEQKKPRIMGIIGLLFILWLAGYFFSLFFESDARIATGNVLVIPIKGIILTDEDHGGLIEEVTVSSDIIEDIEEAAEDSSIKAVVFEINSPGGSGVASDEIGQAIKRLEKPTASYIREAGASGAYWIASATDKIYANRMSITGSIGVIASYLQFSGLLDDYNITYQRLVSGKYKDMGSPFKDLGSEEKAILQKSIDLIHGEFISEVAANRNLSVEQVTSLATGRIYLGSEAIELGLIDGLGGKEEVKAYLEGLLNISVSFFEYEEEESLLKLFSELMDNKAFRVGQGIGASLARPAAENRVVRIWS